MCLQNEWGGIIGCFCNVGITRLVCGTGDSVCRTQMRMHRSLDLEPRPSKHSCRYVWGNGMAGADPTVTEHRPTVKCYVTK